LKQLDTPTLYWGKQDLSELPDGVIEAITAAPHYFDLTAGSAQVPYHFALLGKMVSVNDRNPYAHLGHDWTMHRHADDHGPEDGYLLKAVDRTRPSRVGSMRSWITSYSDLRHYITEEVATYLDALCWNSSPMGEMRAAVCRALVRWNRDDTRRAWTQGVTALDVWQERIVDELVEQRQMRLKVPMNCRTYHGDVETILENAEMPHGTVCYIDPAWPWKKEYVEDDAVNPYEFFTYEVGGIATQDHVQRFAFWTNDDEETPMRDVGRWITTAFNRGAEKFIVSTQSTNSPDPKEVFDYLTNFLGFKRAYFGQRETTSSWDGQTYTDQFTIYDASR
jgi:hypothetical protein